jgi:hypothetical protein
MKMLTVAAFICAIGAPIICSPTAADAQQRGRRSDLTACPVGTCGPTGGQYARTVAGCKKSNCPKTR